MLARNRRLHRFVTNVQIFAGVVGCPSTPRERMRMFAQLLDVAPVASRADQLIYERLLSDALKRLHESLGVPASRLGMSRYMTVADVRREFAMLQLLRFSVTNKRIARFLDVLRERFRDSDLTESDVAEVLEISAPHLSRSVNRETGHGFRWHLRMIRIDHACYLLASSDSAMKEILQNQDSQTPVNSITSLSASLVWRRPLIAKFTAADYCAKGTTSSKRGLSNLQI
jgi:AraC-like DNA-binding protein